MSFLWKKMFGKIDSKLVFFGEIYLMAFINNAIR